MPNFYTDVLQRDPRFNSTVRIDDLALLEPVTRAAVQAILAEAKTHGIDYMVFETFRSQARQQLLFNQGATRLRQVGVHHYGLACDIVIQVAGSPSWKGDFTLLGTLAKAHGLVWGGDWGTAGAHPSFVDSDHVQRCTVSEQDQLFRGIWYPAPGASS